MINEEKKDFHGMMNDRIDLKKKMYREACEQLRGLISGVPHIIASLANTSALLAETMRDINWVGFYLMEKGKLVLGPFQGKPACIEIRPGQGVCGTAVVKDEIMLVKDVHTFQGHIACDAASRSEIVIPIHAKGKVIGVLDIDSPSIGRFDEEDAEGLREVVHILEQALWKEPSKEFTLFDNLDKLHTTELGAERIKKNLGLKTEDVVGWCREQIQTFGEAAERKGKNWYIKADDWEITVSAYSYTIITAHKSRL